MSEPLDLDAIEQSEGGKGLRVRLEQSLAELNELRSEAATLRAEKAIGANGWSLLKPEDLVGVAPDEQSTVGARLQEERESSRLEAARSVLVERGLDPDTVLAGGTVASPPVEDQAWGQLRAVGGEPLGRTDPVAAGLHGPALIEHALRQGAGKPGS